ncbi:13919_t:CDS:2 [Funneliformis geosporum]|nr:13919_t:CDS:2 [Funneliformis geosporum]
MARALIKKASKLSKPDNLPIRARVLPKTQKYFLKYLIFGNKVIMKKCNEGLKTEEISQ